MSRTDGARRLLVGLVLVPWTLLFMSLYLLVGLVLWPFNALVEVAFGDGLVPENSTLGYGLYVGQDNLQWVIAGRGDPEWVPF
jgi:hypothetical protein